MAFLPADGRGSRPERVQIGMPRRIVNLLRGTQSHIRFPEAKSNPFESYSSRAGQCVTDAPSAVSRNSVGLTPTRSRKALLNGASEA